MALILPVLLFVGVGCGKTKAPVVPDAPSAAPESALETLGDEAAILDGDACTHPYYPLIEGYTIDYRHITSEIAPFSYKMSVSDVRPGKGANLNFSFTEPVPFTAVQELICEGKNIKAKAYLDIGGEIGKAMTGMSMKTETKSVSGEIMPSKLEVGTSWTTEFEFRTQIEGLPAGAGLGDMTAVAISVNKVLAEEDVTVSAGTYKAMKIESTTTTNTTLSTGANIPPSVSTQYQWWVKGVGLVKMTSVSSGSTVTTEAVSITK